MAVNQFRTSSQLVREINKRMIKAIDSLGDKVLSELKANVEEEIYSWTPSKYKRTNMLLNSISKTKAENVNGKIQCYIYFDAKKISSIFRMPSEWNAHASWTGDTIDGNDIVNWLENGTVNKWYSHDESKFFKETIEWLTYEYTNLLKKELMNMGIEIM